MSRSFKINPLDNVATMLDDAAAGEEVDVLGEAGARVRALEPIAQPHKIAVCDIPRGLPVIKFGVRVGHARRDIRAGEWVHLHNITSDFDERSQTLGVHTGAVTDTRYE